MNIYDSLSFFTHLYASFFMPLSPSLRVYKRGVHLFTFNLELERMVINLIPTWNSGQTIVDLLVDSLVVVEFKKIIIADVKCD